jgi:hypothetical protein
MNEYIVTKSPWPTELPVGTIIISDNKVWFERKDGQRVFKKGLDKQYDRTLHFKLFSDEFKSNL